MSGFPFFSLQDLTYKRLFVVHGAGDASPSGAPDRPSLELFKPGGCCVISRYPAYVGLLSVVMIFGFIFGIVCPTPFVSQIPVLLHSLMHIHFRASESCVIRLH